MIIIIIHDGHSDVVCLVLVFLPNEIVRLASSLSTTVARLVFPGFPFFSTDVNRIVVADVVVFHIPMLILLQGLGIFPSVRWSRTIIDAY